METPEKPSPTEPVKEPLTGAYLSPKLREKLLESEGAEEWEPKGSSPLPWIVVAVLVLAGGIWGVSALRASAAKRKSAEEARAAQHTADSLAAAARADSLRALVRDTTAVASAASGAAGAKAPGAATPATGSSAATTAGAAASKPAAATSSSDAGAKPAAPAASSSFGLAVATYMFEDRAQSEKERLASATGLEARIKEASEGGTTVYRLILGSFASRAAAERKAEELTGQNLVTQATVIPLR